MSESVQAASLLERPTQPALYLVPAPLSQIAPSVELLPSDLQTVQRIKRWLVETPKTARAWLKLYAHPEPLANLTLSSLSELDSPDALADWMSADTSDVGVLSDAGCPGVADPGAQAVAVAHQLGWKVCPMVGASSLLLALMGSGMSGQSFVFHGYLPVDASQRRRSIEETERQSARLAQTQMAIETPYRNAALFQALCATLHPTTMLCVASELRGPGQRIRSQPVAAWKRQPFDPGKLATLFVWQAVTHTGKSAVNAVAVNRKGPSAGSRRS